MELCKSCDQRISAALTYLPKPLSPLAAPDLTSLPWGRPCASPRSRAAVSHRRCDMKHRVAHCSERGTGHAANRNYHRNAENLKGRTIEEKIVSGQPEIQKQVFIKGATFPNLQHRPRQDLSLERRDPSTDQIPQAGSLRIGEGCRLRQDLRRLCDLAIH